MAVSRGSWYLALLSALCIMAASITEVITLTWRNWLQLTLPPDFEHHNKTRRLFIGLWGVCGPNIGECYAFHADGQDLPWHLQISIFLSMFSICLLFLAFCLSFVELLYMMNGKETFPLKKAQIYLVLSIEILSIAIAATMGLLSIAGYEQSLWSTLKEQIHLSGPQDLPVESRCSLGQAWGFQVLIIVYLTCYLLLTRIQLTKSLDHTETLVARHIQETLLRPRIVLLTPELTGSATRTHRTPPPAYSPPPLYTEEGVRVSYLRIPEGEEEQEDQIRTGCPEMSACLHDCARRGSNYPIELRQLLI